MTSSTPAVTDAGPLRIGEVAEMAGVTTRTLRYWEQFGLVRPSAHRPGGQRLYTPEEVQRVARIRELQGLLGLPLAEIKAILETDDILERFKTANREGAQAARRKRLLEDAIAANDQLVGLLEDRLRRIEDFRQERVAKGKRLKARLVELG